MNINSSSNNQRKNNDDERPTTTSTIPPPLPPFRSVRMNVGPAPVMVQPQSFGAKAPMMPGASSFEFGGSKQAVQGKMAPPKPMGFSSGSMSTTNNSISTTTTNSNTKFAWKVDSVQTVPVYHPLERTAVTFGEEHPLELITKRISDFMKHQSIHCDYDSSMARVVCSTNSCLHFSVQLWQNKNGAVIMEMQRKQGCAIRMQSYRQQLKESILMGDEAATSKTQDTGCPAGLKQQLARMVPAIPASEQQGSCIDLCQELLASNLVDQNRMGLESLCVLTDASKVQDSSSASEKILQDSKLQMLLLKYFAEQEQANLHLLAIKAVAQALESTSTASASLKIDLSSVFWQTVLQALYQHIQRPHEKPLEAALSIKALRLLQQSCPECLTVLQRKYSLPVTAFLQIAHEFGKQHSSSLEREAMQFIMMANVH
mmetsp:Transcript_20857/g.51211  ORF Transcript_20857/g.51211 Transcript_20857/m.51211 type:complete len:429 (-) Transcript_20857:602-1888(-)